MLITCATQGILPLNVSNPKLRYSSLNLEIKTLLLEALSLVILYYISIK